LQEMGCVSYRGIDITDGLFPSLREKFPEYRFDKLDITKVKLASKYDLILMIDVTQHITSDAKFRYALKNIKKSLNRNSLFIVTSWLDKYKKNSFYEKSRTLENYKEVFHSYNISESIKFRDKFIFSITGKSY